MLITRARLELQAAVKHSSIQAVSAVWKRPYSVRERICTVIAMQTGVRHIVVP